MKRTNVVNEFARLQRESQRALGLLGDLLAEPCTKPVESGRPRRIALVVQPQPVIRYSRTS
jgi:hypothetical protein